MQDNAVKQAKQELKARKAEAKNKKKQEKKEAQAAKQKDKQAAKAKKQDNKKAAKAKKLESQKAAKAKKMQAKQAKAAKKGKNDGGEEQTKRKLNMKVVIPLAIVLLAGIAAGVYFFFLRGDEGLTPPTAYAIGEESTIVLDGFLEEGGKLVAVNLQLPEGSEEAKEDTKDDDGEEGMAEPQILPLDTVAVYEYKGVTPTALDSYLDALLAESEGFVLVDEEYNEQETRPVFAVAESSEEAAEGDEKDKDDKEEAESKPVLQDGTALLARENNAESAEGRLFQLRLTWTADDLCTVEVSCPQAEFPTESLMNSSGALSYIKSQRPSDLGLPGESMDEYNIYNQDGVLVIDGRVYRKFNVYEPDERTGVNAYVGEYLISGDGRSIFKRDSLTGELERVK